MRTVLRACLEGFATQRACEGRQHLVLSARTRLHSRADQGVPAKPMIWSAGLETPRGRGADRVCRSQWWLDRQAKEAPPQ
jgi:hypothetical protein